MGRRIAVFSLLVVGVALIVAAGVYNLRLRRALQKTQQQNLALARAASSAASTVDSAGNPDAKPMLGKVAPAFTLVDLKGKKVSLADFKGHPVVLNFWATYCGPCKLEMPWFQALAAKYQPQGLVILGIDQDDGMAASAVAAAAKKVGVSYPILMPDNKVAQEYQVGDYIPETYYVGKNGKIVEQNVGVYSKSDMEADIQKAIASTGAM